MLRLGPGFARRGTAYEAMGTDAKKGYPTDQSKEEAAQYVIDTVEYINDVESITFVE